MYKRKILDEPMTVYRLEDINGEGPYYHLDGSPKRPVDDYIDEDISYRCAFSNLNDFNTTSYLEFYSSDNYFLYEIRVNVVIYTSKLTSEVDFDINGVLSKKLISKPKLIN